MHPGIYLFAFRLHGRAGFLQIIDSEHDLTSCGQIEQFNIHTCGRQPSGYSSQLSSPVRNGCDQNWPLTTHFDARRLKRPPGGGCVLDQEMDHSLPSTRNPTASINVDARLTESLAQFGQCSRPVFQYNAKICSHGLSPFVSINNEEKSH
jgi:hypothetical protein